jgi:hypothetical protein
MLDRLPHDVLVDLARSFDVVDRVVLSEVCRACRDATREALAVDRRFGTRADSHGDLESRELFPVTGNTWPYTACPGLRGRGNTG